MATLDELRQYYGQSEGDNLEASVGREGHLGGHQGRMDQFTYNTFQEVMGRAPTQDEFSQFSAMMPGANWESEVRNLRGILSTYKKQYAESPEGRGERAGEYSGDVTNQFQTLFGRAPTEEELQHFGSNRSPRWLVGNQLGVWVLCIPAEPEGPVSR